MTPHMPKVTCRSGHAAQLQKIVKKAPPPAKKAHNQEEKNEPIVSVGIPVFVENSSVYLDVVEQLGKGSFGEVFKVRYENFDRCLAMKVVPTENARQQEKVKEEVDLLMELRQHDLGEFILKTLITFWTSRNNQMAMCFVSELLDRTMADMLDDARGSPLNVVQVKAVGYQVLSALDRLHTIGVTHCDIKPDNVMIVDLEKQPLRVKIIDFGLAKHTRSLRQGAKIQNIVYRAPEVVFNLPLSEKLDIWSTAVMLCEIYTALDLFPAEHEPELARYMESAVGLPKEVEVGSVTAKFMIYDVDKGCHTVMSFSETQAQELFDVENDQRYIIGLDQIPQLGHNTQIGKGVTEDDLNFLDVLRKMLRPNTTDRYGAKDALQTPFFTSFDGNYNP